MSNRYYYKNHMSLEIDVTSLFGSFTVGAAGAVGVVKGGGIKSVVKNATAGNYTINFDGKYTHFFEFISNVIGVGTAISGVSKIEILGAPATFQADIIANKAITIQLIDYSGAAVNVASGSQIYFDAKFRVSSIGRFD